MEKRELGVGNVPFVLIDTSGVQQPAVLKPSLHAARTLSRKYGGLQTILDKIGKLDFDAIVDVLEAGMQISVGNPKARAELEASVFASGFDGPGLAAIQYVRVLLNGGKPPADDGPQEAVQVNPPTA